VADELKAEREKEIMLAQQRIAFENAAYLAEQRSQFDVLIDGAAHGGTGVSPVQHARSDSNGRDARATRMYVGRCYHQAPQVDSVTYVHSTAELSPGELVRCTVVSSDGYDLIAQPTEQSERKIALPLAR
jgi:hypothetical protein